MSLFDAYFLNRYLCLYPYLCCQYLMHVSLPLPISLSFIVTILFLFLSFIFIFTQVSALFYACFFTFIYHLYLYLCPHYFMSVISIVPLSLPLCLSLFFSFTSTEHTLLTVCGRSMICSRTGSAWRICCWRNREQERKVRSASSLLLLLLSIAYIALNRPQGKTLSALFTIFFHYLLSFHQLPQNISATFPPNTALIPAI